MSNKQILNKASGLKNLPQYREETNCERCGASFTCGATLSGCWCQEIELSEAIRTELQSRYEHCLCRTCLEEFAEGKGNDGEKKEEPLFTRQAH